MSVVVQPTVERWAVRWEACRLDPINLPWVLNVLEALDADPSLRRSFRVLLDVPVKAGRPLNGPVSHLLRHAVDDADDLDAPAADVFALDLYHLRHLLAPDPENEDDVCP